ncbi:MAG: hypothetical protein LUC45_06525 [Paraprevotella sp.]|nr:hypothetical protein [Paraprevotella sp.]
MKKNTFLSLCAGLIALFCIEACSIVTTAVDIKREVQKFPMEVKLTDGTLLAGTAKLPNARTKKVTLKEEDWTEHKVASAYIDYLTAWDEKNPDGSFMLVYKNKSWMVPKAVGKYLAFFAQSDDYWINKKGVMVLKGTRIIYYGFRAGEDESKSFFIEDGSTRSARKTLLENLSDDEELCKMIESQEIKPFDLDRICELYNPEK